MTTGPAVVQILQEGQPQLLLGGVEGQNLTEQLGLVPDTLAVGQRCRRGVTEAAHTPQRSEVVVEGAVLLHQDHDVLHVAQRTGAVVGRQRGGLVDGAHQGGRGGGGAGELEKPTTINGGHNHADNRTWATPNPQLRERLMTHCCQVGAAIQPAPTVRSARRQREAARLDRMSG